jgi:tetratricopeptide (TPR) repeat protein
VALRTEIHAGEVDTVGHIRAALVSGILVAALATLGGAAFAHDSGGMGGGSGSSGGGTGGGSGSDGASQVSAARTYFNQGQEFAKKQSWYLAIQAYQQSVRLDPKFIDAWNNLGHAYRKTKDYDKALDAYKRALELKPDYADAHEYLGRTYLAMGNKDAAMREHEILKRLDAKMAGELLKAIQANNADLGD